MPKLYYFRAPNFDISSDSLTAPKLGSIFASLKRLTSPLNQDEYVSIPTNLRNSSDKVGFKDSGIKNVKASGGVYADVASGVGGSAELIYGFAKDRKTVYTCDVLETDEFDPTLEFVQDCVRASQRVQEYIQKSFVGNKTVYLITGLKIATGLRVAVSASSEHTAPSLKIGISGLLFGVPGEAGPKGDVKHGTGRDLEYAAAGSSKIVFAYRAIKVRPQRDGAVKYKDISGGQYGVGDEDGDKDDDALEMEELSEEDIAKYFPDAELMSVEHGDDQS